MCKVHLTQWRYHLGGCEGGGGGDGGGGDPVEEEPSLPLLVHLQACRVLHRYFFILSLEGGRLNCSFWFHPIQGDGSPLPACAGGNGCWGDVADGSSLQGWGCGRGADKKQLGLPHHLLTQPETFGSVFGNYERKGTYTALPRKATTRMIWFILRAVWYFQHWLNQEWASFYIHNKPKKVEKSAVISTATNASADWTITFSLSQVWVAESEKLWWVMIHTEDSTKAALGSEGKFIQKKNTEHQYIINALAQSTHSVIFSRYNKIFWGLEWSTKIWHDLLRSHKIYWDITRSNEISHNLLTFVIWHVTFDLPHLTFDFLLLTHKIWHLTLGIWHLTFELWYLTFAI